MPTVLERLVAMEEPDRMLTAKAVATRLNCNIRTVYRLAERGELQGYFITGMWRFKEEDVNRYIESQKWSPDQKRA